MKSELFDSGECALWICGRHLNSEKDQNENKSKKEEQQKKFLAYKEVCGIWVYWDL